MATIKSFTDIEQSTKLAEILPIESADMYWWYNGQRYYVETIEHNDFQKRDIPAWSLAALLDVLIYPHIEQNCMGQWVCRVERQNTTYLWEGSNPIDACYEMILKLNKEDLL